MTVSIKTSGAFEAGVESGNQSVSFLPTPRYLLITAFAFLLFYLPFFFGPSHTYVRIHDNLDNEAVYNTVNGIFFFHPSEARHLLLDGNVPIYLVQRLDWPLLLLHVIPNPFIAYAATDVVVRIIAFLGMFCLSRRLGVAESTAFLAGVLFSFSLTLTALGLSVAATPAVVYLSQKAADHGLRGRDYLLLFLLGWNCSLVFSGVFLLVGLPVLRRLFFGEAVHRWLAAYVSYALGLVVGAVGLIYGLVAGSPLHRNQWVLSGDGLTGSVRTFLRNQFSVGHWDFHHVSTPLAFVYLSILIAALATKKRKLWSIVGVIVFVNAFYALVHFAPIAQLRTRIGGLIKAFQFDRFYSLASFLIIAGWVIAMSVAGARLRRLLIGAIVVQLAVTVALTPQLQSPVLLLLGKPTIASFEEHTKPQDYRLIHNLVGEEPTISVGLDPMAAVMNGISTIDGYYNAYPLSYKEAFRAIIARQLQSGQPYSDDWGSGLRIANPQSYFDNWGSRLYTFVENPAEAKLDYCAAFHLGAQFVLSRFDLMSPNLDPVLTTAPQHVRVYSIRNCQ